MGSIQCCTRKTKATAANMQINTNKTVLGMISSSTSIYWKMNKINVFSKMKTKPNAFMSENCNAPINVKPKEGK